MSSAGIPRNAAQRPGSKRQMLTGVLGGMAPLLVAIVPFTLGLWSLGLVIVVVGAFVVLLVRLVRHSPMSALDLSASAFGVLLAIAYFGFGATYLLQHFGVVIYALLLLQVLIGEIRGHPFTTQYAMKMYPREVSSTRAFGFSLAIPTRESVSLPRVGPHLRGRDPDVNFRCDAICAVRAA
jgi:hypothetical protein